MQWLPDGRKDGSPFNPKNFLVSIGYKCFDDTGIIAENYLFFEHAEGIRECDKDAFNEFQKVLDNSELIIAHNLKFDLIWLREVGFKYDGKYWCTQIGEYIYARGITQFLSLEASCIRRKVALKKSQLVKDYLDKGIGYDKMPRDIVMEYGIGDVQSCYELYLRQQELYALDKNKGLLPTVYMTNEFMEVLCDIERNGLYTNLNALNAVERDYLIEKQTLEHDLQILVHELMGDTPINLASPEQLSWVNYSRKVDNKKKWAELFNIGPDERGKPKKRPYMNVATLRDNIRKSSSIIKKTTAESEEVGPSAPDGLPQLIRADRKPLAKRATEVCQAAKADRFRDFVDF